MKSLLVASGVVAVLAGAVGALPQAVLVGIAVASAATVLAGTAVTMARRSPLSF